MIFSVFKKIGFSGILGPPMASVLLSATVKTCFVSRMRDFIVRLFVCGCISFGIFGVCLCFLVLGGLGVVIFRFLVIWGLGTPGSS